MEIGSSCRDLPRSSCSRRSSWAIVLGVALDRGGPFVSAQATRTATAPETGRPPPSPAATAQAKASDEDEALYQQLDRQYEQFEHVNRTFELVAKAVSPAVVHIVAQKTSRAEESPRIRHYEETGSGVDRRGAIAAAASTS